MSKKSKAFWRKGQVVRVTYEADYSDDAWRVDGVSPSPATHPDAFYAKRESAYPLPKALNARKSPHKRLSKTALRKRLYQAGVRGDRVNKLALEILAGPAATDLLRSTGLVALGWNIEAFKKQFGKRIARSVLRFVTQSLIMLDEGWMLLNTPTISASIEGMFRTARKFNSKFIDVNQISPIL